MHPDVEELRNHAAPVARFRQEREQHRAIIRHEANIDNRTERAAEHPSHLVHFREEEIKHRQRNHTEKSRDKNAHSAALRSRRGNVAAFDRYRLFVFFQKQEKEPNQERDPAKPDIRRANPEQFVVNDFLKLIRRHQRAFVRRCRIQIRQNKLLCEQNPRNRTNRVKRLCKVQTAHRRFLRSHRKHVRITSRFQKRTAAGNYENRDKINVETLRDTRGNIHQRAEDINAEPDENALFVGKFLNQNRGENRQHGIRPVKGDLHERRLFLRNGKDVFKCRNKIVRHVVKQAPQRKAGDEHDKRHKKLLGHNRVR